MRWPRRAPAGPPDPAPKHLVGCLPAMAANQPERDPPAPHLKEVADACNSRFLQGPFAPVTRRSPRSTCQSPAACPPGSTGVTCVTAPTRWAWTTRTTTGSWARAWCTASGCGTAAPSGTATAGSAPRPSPEPLGETWPAGPVHENMDFAANTHIIRHAGRILATVEAGPLPYELSEELETLGPVRLRRDAARRVRRAHQTGPRGPANCTRSRTSGPGTTSSTSSSTPAAW